MHSILKYLDYFPEIFKKLSLIAPEYIKNNISSIREDIIIKMLQKGYLFNGIRITEDCDICFN